MRAALEQSAVLSREQLGTATSAVTSGVQAELAAKKDVIDTRLDEVRSEMRDRAAAPRRAGHRPGHGQRPALRPGRRVAADARRGRRHAGRLRRACCARRWPTRRPAASGASGWPRTSCAWPGSPSTSTTASRPRSTAARAARTSRSTCPRATCCTWTSSSRWPRTCATSRSHTDAERQAHLKRFLGDVRLRVKELAKRDYAREGDQPAVDYVLLFLPNEQLAGFIHEHDPELLDHAMGQRVVMCSPLTLFAFLGIIRQAFDNFMIERTSDEILSLIGKFGQQWQKYTESAEKVKRHLEAVQREFDQLTGTRRRALERPLQQLEELRVQRNLPVDGELFPDADLDNVARAWA